jgi:hypothetical protein
LAYFYNLLGNEILIVRSFFGDETVFAPKTLFTVFRVALIEIVCAPAIEVMRRNSANENAEYYPMWSILLYTIAFKSLFQAFEIVSSGDLAKLFYYLTFAVVIIGIIFALFKGWSYFSNLFRGNFKFSNSERLILFTVLLAYLGLAIIPIFIFN